PILRRRSALRPLEPHADAVLDASPTGEVRAGVAAAVRSLVVLGRWNWLKFVEELSPVEAVLRGDPARVYARMDFASRDHYRHAVAGFSRESGMTEHEVAERAVRLAAAVDPGAPPETRHVGYYLIDAGATDLAKSVGLP